MLEIIKKVLEERIKDEEKAMSIFNSIEIRLGELMFDKEELKTIQGNSKACIVKLGNESRRFEKYSVKEDTPDSIKKDIPDLKNGMIEFINDEIKIHRQIVKKCERLWLNEKS